MRYTRIIKRKLPLSLKLARQHLRVGDDRSSDALIEAKLEMAVGVAEDFTGRIIRERYVEFDVLLDVGDETVSLPSHTSGIAEVSCSGKVIPKDEYVFMAGDYSVLLMFLQPGKYSGQTIRIKSYEGYSRETIPAPIKAAILLILGTLYDNESDQIVGRSVSELSLTAEKLLAPWRITPYGNV